MPIYEYNCTKCEAEFEELVLNTAEPVRCPECGSEDTRKLMSRCRAQMAGGQDTEGGASSGGGGCSSCSGGSCATCG